MLKCKTPKQMRLGNSQGHPPNFAAVINQEYCHVSPYRTRTNCSFKYFSGRHKSVFMATLGRYGGRLANMKIKSSLGRHPNMLNCVESQARRKSVQWHNSLTKHRLGCAIYIPSTGLYQSPCFVFMPVFRALMKLVCLFLRITDTFQFTATSSFSDTILRPDLKQQQVLILHLADVELISIINI